MNQGNNRLLPGMIAWADVRNPKENPLCRGKRRPCIVVERQQGQVWIVGLTTETHFRNGLPRVPVPTLPHLGLTRRSHLWGDALTRVSALDIEDHIGWVTPHLAELACEHVKMTVQQAESLRQAAVSAHSHNLAA